MAQGTAADGARQETLALSYASMEAARRDRLGDVPSGLIVKTRTPLGRGAAVAVRLDLEKEKVSLDLAGEVLWVTPLLSGALAGVGLAARGHRSQVQLDLLFGHRTAGPGRAPPRSAAEPPADAVAPPNAAVSMAAAAAPLSVAMLQPNAVLRTVLANALARLKGRWDVTVDARGDVHGFMAALSDMPRALAIIDCDVLGPAAEPLVHAIRSHDPWKRLPLILLASEGHSRLQDPFAVFMKKPIETKTFLDLAGILVAGTRPR